MRVEAVLSLGTVKHRFSYLVVGELIILDVKEASNDLQAFATDLLFVLGFEPVVGDDTFEEFLATS